MRPRRIASDDTVPDVPDMQPPAKRVRTIDVETTVVNTSDAIDWGDLLSFFGESIDNTVFTMTEIEQMLFTSTEVAVVLENM